MLNGLNVCYESSCSNVDTSNVDVSILEDHFQGDPRLDETYDILHIHITHIYKAVSIYFLYVLKILFQFCSVDTTKFLKFIA